MVILAQRALLITSKALKGRINWIASSAQKVENALSVYRFSIPLLLTATVYIGRREILESLIESIKTLFNLAEEAGSSLSELLQDSDQLAAKVERRTPRGVKWNPRIGSLYSFC